MGMSHPADYGARMTIRAPLVVSALIVTIATGGCSSDGTDAASTPSASQSPSDIPVQVSAEAVCTEITDHLLAGVEIAAAIGADPSMATTDVAEVSDVAQAFEHAAEVAPANMRPALSVQAETMREIEDVILTRRNRTLDFQDFRSTNIDLVFMCGEVLGD